MSTIDSIPSNTKYFAGEVERINVSNDTKSIVVGVYSRIFDVNTHQVTEVSDAIIDGKHHKDIFVFDHNEGQLNALDPSGKVVSSTPFECNGKFPQIKNCKYKFQGNKYFFDGSDTYTSNSIHFDSKLVERDEEYHIIGSYAEISKSDYKKKLAEIESLVGVAE